MDDDVYKKLIDDVDSVFKKRSDLKAFYFEFLNDFKNYLTEFVRESSVDLTISEFEVTTEPQKLFFGEYGGMHVTLKNQGEMACYLTTDRRGAYRLDPNERQRFWLNKETTVVTTSGTTRVGFIRS